MKCVNCDAEIKDGSIYCPICGKEAQMVNGYTSLEDDFLHSLLREEIKPQLEKGKKALSQEEQLRVQKWRKILPAIVIGLLLTAMISIGLVVKIFVDHKNNNSYNYQMQMAQKEIADYNYESALQYLKRALVIVPEDIESRMEMVEIYLMKKEQDSAIVLLTEVIQLDKEKKEAYQQLIDIYAEKGQFKQIQSLAEYAEDESVKELFKDYLVAVPTISPSGDTFYSEVNVTIFSGENDAIYYTTDGTDPVTNGKRYVEGVGINLSSSGLYTIKAVCKNRKNIYSDVVKYEYQIILTPPEETEAFTEEIFGVTE